MIKRNKTNRVIFHHSLSKTGNVERIRKWHLDRGWDDIGYHYVILRDGTIEHGRDIKYKGAHAKGSNSDSIGVCLIGDFRIQKPTKEQIMASAVIYHDFCRSYSKSLNIQFHNNKCPGENLDRFQFKHELKLRDPFNTNEESNGGKSIMDNKLILFIIAILSITPIAIFKSDVLLKLISDNAVITSTGGGALVSIVSVLTLMRKMISKWGKAISIMYEFYETRKDDLMDDDKFKSVVHSFDEATNYTAKVCRVVGMTKTSNYLKNLVITNN
jgi:hypothetical protein